MQRKQLAVVFCVLLGWPMMMAAVRAQAEGLSIDESLIGYDDRGVQQANDDAHAQPCQSCPPACACQSCPSEADCQCNASEPVHTSAAAPLIMTIGPPPRLYSPSADFGSRVQTGSASWTVVGDENAVAFQHPTVPATLTAASVARMLLRRCPLRVEAMECCRQRPNVVATYPPTMVDVPASCICSSRSCTQVIRRPRICRRRLLIFSRQLRPIQFLERPIGWITCCRRSIIWKPPACRLRPINCAACATTNCSRLSAS